MEQLISTGEATSSKEKGRLNTGVASLPDLYKDVTDRNRTSPFAFTGNKFEFRMVGSQDSIAEPNTVLNTITAEAFAEACDVLEKADDFDKAVREVIAANFREHSRIIFNGNGYSAAWEKEAERRGLPNIRCMADAISELVSDKSVAMFEKFHVFTRSELESRAEIKYENYAKTINIEAKAMINIASKRIIPSVIRWTTELANNIIALRGAGIEDVSVQQSLLQQTETLLKQADAALHRLSDVESRAAAMALGEEQAHYYHDTVCAAMADLRHPVDELEQIVDKSCWPMPSYGDLLFEV